MIRIRIGDIRIGQEERAAINAVLDSGQISEYKKVREFETEWKKFIGTRHCVATNSGTSALLLGLQALLYDDRFKKVKKGCKVITSPLTYTATSNAIVLSGLEPVYVDIDPVRFTLRIDQVETILQKDGDDFCILLPVHLMGYVNDMKSMDYLARKYDLVLFEDAAQAHGSIYEGKKAGSLSLLADFSFYIAHNIQAGEMGAIVTNDTELYKLIKQLKANGRICACPVCMRSEGNCPFNSDDFDPKFTHQYIGYNFKTTEWPAALALCQINKIEWIIKKRSRNVRLLNDKLRDYEDVFQLPEHSEDVSYLAYPVVLRKTAGFSRKDFMRALELKGIEVRPIFGCIPTQQPAYSFMKSAYEGLLPDADYIGRNGFYIGCHQYLTEEDLNYIASSFAEIINGYRKKCRNQH